MASAQEFKNIIKEYAEKLRDTDAWKIDGGGESQNLFNEWIKGYAVDEQIKMHCAVGCDKCNKTGSAGRIGMN